jgi:hypothetical protein
MYVHVRHGEQKTRMWMQLRLPTKPLSVAESKLQVGGLEDRGSIPDRGRDFAVSTSSFMGSGTHKSKIGEFVPVHVMKAYRGE